MDSYGYSGAKCGGGGLGLDVYTGSGSQPPTLGLGDGITEKRYLSKSDAIKYYNRVRRNKEYQVSSTPRRVKAFVNGDFKTYYRKETYIHKITGYIYTFEIVYHFDAYVFEFK